MRRLVTITPIRDGYELRSYSVASCMTKSSAVTAPSVNFRISNRCSTRGMRSPLTYRLIVACVTPIATANSERDMERDARNSASVMSAHYQLGRKNQALRADLVGDISALVKYHIGMTELERIRLERGLSGPELAEKLGCAAVTIWRYEHPEPPDGRPLTDEKASQIAVILACSPFDLKPDFAKEQLAGLPPLRREQVRQMMEMAFIASAAEKNSEKSSASKK